MKIKALGFFDRSLTCVDFGCRQSLVTGANDDGDVGVSNSEGDVLMRSL